MHAGDVESCFGFDSGKWSVRRGCHGAGFGTAIGFHCATGFGTPAGSESLRRNEMVSQGCPWFPTYSVTMPVSSW